MSPHGAGMSGATHSHDPEYPDDNWNLYSMLDHETTIGLNVTKQEDVLRIFKSHANKLSNDINVISDADEEICIIARFTSPVHLRKLMIIGGGDNTDLHPQTLKCYVNVNEIDFSELENMTPAQVFNLPINLNGTVEFNTSLRPFTNIQSCAFFFNTNYGADKTSIRYIGMQGEHTHHRREAVHADYEVLCNGQDVPEGAEVGAGHDHSHSHSHDHGH